MTLLTEVMQRPLDPGYAAAAAAKRAGSRAHRRPGVLAATVVIALLCGGVFATAVRELRRPQPGAVRARAALEQEIERRTAEAERLQASNEKLRAQVAQAQQEALGSGGDSTLAAAANNLGVLTGELPVTGSGLVLTMDDAPGVADSAAADPRANSSNINGRVLDRDLQIVVNGLWASGAEAISVNGERLTALSAIRSAGQAILVDFRPLVPPYVLQAIGNPADLQARFAQDMAGPYLQQLTSNYGIRAGIEAKKSLTLPGAGSLSLHYAHLTGASPSDTSSATSPTAANRSASSTPPSSTGASSVPPSVTTGTTGTHGTGG